MEKKTFKCETCDKSFARKTHLEKHMSSVHEGKKPCKCDICETNFADKYRLKMYVTSVHEKIK